jgi:hypothetical protein
MKRLLVLVILVFVLVSFLTFGQAFAESGLNASETCAYYIN